MDKDTNAGGVALESTPLLGCPHCGAVPVLAGAGWVVQHVSSCFWFGYDRQLVTWIVGHRRVEQWQTRQPNAPAHAGAVATSVQPDVGPSESEKGDR